MRKNLIRRIAASLILSVMLFALPIGAFLANGSNAVSVYADEDMPADEEIVITVNDGTDAGDNTVSGNAGGGEEPGTGEEPGEEPDPEPTPEPTPIPEPTPEPEPECICDHKCSQYDHNPDCPVCSVDYKKCAYKDPNVKISIDIPQGWFSAGTNVKATFKVEDIADTGHFAVKSVKAKIGQNGSYQDVTEAMSLEISENCSIYVLVTDANDKGYERSRAIKCFDTGKPTLNAAVSDGLLTVKAVDNESGIKVIYVNGYEFTDITNGTVNIRLSQFDAGYEYFTITAMDNAGNVSEVYKTRNPYYKDPNVKDDNTNPAELLPKSAEATKPASATAAVTEHTKTDSSGNTTSQTSSFEAQKKEELRLADAQEGAIPGSDRQGEKMNLGMEFYTIEAASGKVFYLIIDRDGEEEQVYFLTEITENDLLNVTTDNSETLPKNSAALESQIPITESALPNNNTDYEETKEVPVPTEAPAQEQESAEEPEPEKEPAPVNGNPLLGYIIMALIGLLAIIAAYYFKVVKPKQDGDFYEDEDEDPDDDDGDYEDDTEVSEKEDLFNNKQEEDEAPKLPLQELEATETIESSDDEDPYESGKDRR